MQAGKRTRTIRPSSQATDDAQLRLVIVAGQILTLVKALTHFGEGLSWQATPDRATVQGIEDLVEIIAEKSAALLALVQAAAKGATK